MYSATHSLTSALDVGGWSMHAPTALPPAEGPGAPCAGGWVGHRARLVGC